MLVPKKNRLEVYKYLFRGAQNCRAQRCETYVSVVGRAGQTLVTP
jgi:hypothetical protein